MVIREWIVSFCKRFFEILWWLSSDWKAQSWEIWVSSNSEKSLQSYEHYNNSLETLHLHEITRATLLLSKN